MAIFAAWLFVASVHRSGFPSSAARWALQIRILRHALRGAGLRGDPHRACREEAPVARCRTGRLVRPHTSRSFVRRVRRHRVAHVQRKPQARAGSSWRYRRTAGRLCAASPRPTAISPPQRRRLGLDRCGRVISTSRRRFASRSRRSGLVRRRRGILCGAPATSATSRNEPLPIALLLGPPPTLHSLRVHRTEAVPWPVSRRPAPLRRPLRAVRRSRGLRLARRQAAWQRQRRRRHVLTTDPDVTHAGIDVGCSAEPGTLRPRYRGRQHSAGAGLAPRRASSCCGVRRHRPGRDRASGQD